MCGPASIGLSPLALFRHGLPIRTLLHGLRNRTLLHGLCSRTLLHGLTGLPKHRLVSLAFVLLLLLGFAAGILHDSAQRTAGHHNCALAGFLWWLAHGRIIRW